MSDANDTRRPLKVEIDVEFEGYSGREHHADALLYPKGLLLRTRYLKPVGTMADFEIFVVDGEAPLRGRGPVVFSRWQDQGPRRPAGLGLRIDQWEGDSAPRAAQWFDEPVVGSSSVDLPPVPGGPVPPVPPIGAFSVRDDSSARLAEIEASLGPLTSEMRRSRDRSDLEALGGAVVEAASVPPMPQIGPVVPSNPWVPEPVDKPYASPGRSSWDVVAALEAPLAPPVDDPPFRAVWAQVDPNAPVAPQLSSASSDSAQSFRPIWSAPEAVPEASTELDEVEPLIYQPLTPQPVSSTAPDADADAERSSAPAFRPTLGGVQVRADEVPIGRDGDVVWAAPSSKGRFLPWIALGLLVGALIAGGYWVYQTRFVSQPSIGASAANVPVEPVPQATLPSPSPTPTRTLLPAEPPSIADAAPVAAAPVTVETAPPPAAVAAPADAPRFRGVREIRVDREGDGLTVVIELDGRVQGKDLSRFRLDNPAREVIRLNGVDRPFERGKIVVGDALLSSVRTGAQPGNALHVVLDLGRGTVRVEPPVIDGTRIILRLRG